MAVLLLRCFFWPTKNHDISCEPPTALSDFDEGVARKATFCVSLALCLHYWLITGIKFLITQLRQMIYPYSSQYASLIRSWDRRGGGGGGAPSPGLSHPKLLLRVPSEIMAPYSSSSRGAGQESNSRRVRPLTLATVAAPPGVLPSHPEGFRFHE